MRKMIRCECDDSTMDVTLHLPDYGNLCFKNTQKNIKRDFTWYINQEKSDQLV